MSEKTNLRVWGMISIVLAALWTAVASADVIYVDAGAAPGGDGSSWAKAYIYLQDALSEVESGDEIWVAAETYRPDTSSANPGGTGNRYATFYLINGVALYGGFPAGGGDWGQRDPSTNETILSGDIGMWLNNQDNSYYVVTGSSVNSTAVLDGFTITAGNADYERGGGMYNYGYSSPTVINCTFSGNSAGYGGGMCNYDHSSPTVVNCAFRGNSADWTGGGMYNYGHCSPMAINCTFSGNSAGYGGGMYNSGISNPTVTGCTFSGNLADWMGGGMCNYGGSPTLMNCVLWGNIAPEPNGPQIAHQTNAALSISYSDLQGGRAAIYDPCGALVWGAGNIDADPLFIDSDGPDNIVGTPDDNLRLLSGSPCIDAGNNTAVPPDSTDLDGDGNIAERTPFDLDGNSRFVDDPRTSDSGYGTPPIVDMGAYEYQITGYVLTVPSSSGGSVTAPGEGIFEYEYGEVVSIIAEADAHYHFVEWTGTAVDAGKVANPTAASTTVTMASDYTLVANFAAGNVVYVDIDADGANNGTSWDDAYNFLQDALAAASSGDQIWVAEATYRPDESTANPSGTNNREATFELINGVGIYGGFPCSGGTWRQRNPNAYETILSGDIGVQGLANYFDNSYHVVTGSGTEPNAILDGFTITAGNADSRFQDDHGGGMLNNSGSPTVSNCVFSSNSSRVGGGMYNGLYSSPTVTNCRFINNSADYGGGMDNDLSSTTVVNCIFSGNTADADFGGGMFIGGSSSCSVINCTFSSNSARVGGGMYNSSSSSLTLTNCILWGNTASSKPQIYNGGTGSATISYCDVQGGWPDESNIDADPLFKDADGPDDIVGTEDDDLRLLAGSPCIDAGDNDAVTTSSDLDGRPRITDADCDDTEIGDMGAYEFTSAYYGDFDGECDVDFGDYAILAGYWLTDEFLVDIAPTPAGDSRTDERDLAVLCNNWLANTRQ